MPDWRLKFQMAAHDFCIEERILAKEHVRWRTLRRFHDEDRIPCITRKKWDPTTEICMACVEHEEASERPASMKRRTLSRRRMLYAFVRMLTDGGPCPSRAAKENK